MPNEKEQLQGPPLPTGMGHKNNKSVRNTPRGFAAMDPAQHRLITSQGGKASHASGKGHQFTPEEARIAGRKGGKATGKRQPPSEASESAS